VDRNIPIPIFTTSYLLILSILLILSKSRYAVYFPSSRAIRSLALT